jgi:glutathione S-transferase/GST-like protein
MLELYHWEPNIFFLKPLVALAEKGIEYTSHYFDPTNFEQFRPDFPANRESQLQLEREGPVLVHDGAIISSSFFMLEYIAETFPGPTLLPADPSERYRMHAWGQIIALTLGSAVATLGCERYLAPALRSRAAAPLRAQIATIEPLERRSAWAAVVAAGDDEAAARAARDRLALPVARIEAALGRSAWLAGSEYSIADIDAFAMLDPLPSLAPAIVSQRSTPHIDAFLERMHARPAVRAALALSRTGRPAEAFVPGAEGSRWG